MSEKNTSDFKHKITNGVNNFTPFKIDSVLWEFQKKNTFMLRGKYK